MKAITSQLNFNVIKLNNLFFHDIKSDGDGGAIYLYKNSASLNMDTAIFSHCRTEFSLQKTGGCIFFVSISGGFECSKACVADCSSYISSFLYSEIDEKEENKCNNSIKLSSYTRCPSDCRISFQGVCRFKRGLSYTDEMNSSLNKISDMNNFGIEYGNDYFGRYINFYNDTSSALFCLWDSKSQSILEYSSFIQCDRLTYEYNLIHYSNPNQQIGMTIQNCIFMGNEMALFEVNIKGMIYVVNCYIDEYSYNTNKLPPSTTNIFPIPNELLNIDWEHKNSCSPNLKDSHIFPIFKSIKSNVCMNMLFIILHYSNTS